MIDRPNASIVGHTQGTQVVNAPPSTCHSKVSTIPVLSICTFHVCDPVPLVTTNISLLEEGHAEKTIGLARGVGSTSAYVVPSKKPIGSTPFIQ